MTVACLLLVTHDAVCTCLRRRASVLCPASADKQLKAHVAVLVSRCASVVQRLVIRVRLIALRVLSSSLFMLNVYAERVSCVMCRFMCAAPAASVCDYVWLAGRGRGRFVCREQAPVSYLHLRCPPAMPDGRAVLALASCLRVSCAMSHRSRTCSSNHCRTRR